MRVPIFPILYHVSIYSSTPLSLQEQISFLDHVIVTIVKLKGKNKSSSLACITVCIGP